jgi:hypothetical protein
MSGYGDRDRYRDRERDRYDNDTFFRGGLFFVPLFPQSSALCNFGMSHSFDACHHPTYRSRSRSRERGRGYHDRGRDRDYDRPRRISLLVRNLGFDTR